MFHLTAAFGQPIGRRGWGTINKSPEATAIREMKKTELNGKKAGKNPAHARRGLYFLLSLLLHGIITLVLLFNPAFDPNRFTPRKISEVELVDPEELLNALKRQNQKDPKGQIVEQSENAINDEVPEDARFLSRHNQKVIRETQAAVRGKFKNSDGTQGQNRKSSNQRLQADATDELLRDNNGIGPSKKPKLKDLIPSFKPSQPSPEKNHEVAGGSGDGPSATDDHLKNVETGLQTLLSSREFVYYSYYNRIKDKLRQYWEPKIKEKVERIIRQGRTIASDTDRITRVVIILDQTGTLVKVQIISPSGVKDLDDAAVEAFRAAAPFPNPPKGIVDADGTIKIRWDFILEANASSLLNSFRLARIPQ